MNDTYVCGNDNSSYGIAKTEKRWLSVSEAAAYLGCSRGFLDNDRCSRLLGIPFVRLGRHIRYERAQLDEWMKAHEVNTTNKESNHA